MIAVHVMQLAPVRVLITGNGAVKNIMPHLVTLFVKHLIRIAVICTKVYPRLMAVKNTLMAVHQSVRLPIKITAAIMTQ